MIRFVIAICVIALLAIAALALTPVTVTDQDNGKTIDVFRFRTIKLTLDSNPTTGYSWQLRAPGDGKVLQLYFTTFRLPKTRLVGAGGREEWKFRAMAPGSVVIRTEYLRPWEKPEAPVKTFTLTVRVR